MSTYCSRGGDWTVSPKLCVNQRHEWQGLVAFSESHLLFPPILSNLFCFTSHAYLGDLAEKLGNA